MPATTSSAMSCAHTWFENNLSEIQSRARARFGGLDPDRREEAVAEVMANVYKAVDSAARRGTLSNVTPFHLVNFAAKHYRQGRWMAGYSSTDVMSEATRRRGRVNVVLMSSPVTRGDDEDAPTLAEVLADRGDDADPFEATRRNHDYEEIMRNEGVSQKARATFGLLSMDRGLGCGLRIARALGVSPGRVCQLKSELAAALGRHGYTPMSAAVA